MGALIQSRKGNKAMQKVLLAVDGSDNSVRATQALIDSLSQYKEPPEIHVVTVHRPVPNVGTAGVVLSDEMIEKHYREDCDKALAPVTATLEQANVRYKAHCMVGDPAETIEKTAEELGCQEIVMGNKGHSAVADVVMGSISAKVSKDAKVPVKLVH
jgi:nucleotide-binding universal stress UspA family protein